MRILQNVNIDFLSRRTIFYIISASLIIVGFAVLLINGLTLGIDFKGGSEILVRFKQDISIQDVRSSMANIGFNGAEIKTMGNERDILIRTSEEGEGTTVTDKIRTALTTDNPNNSYEVLRIDKVGPKIGNELRLAAIYATAFAFIAILIYLAFRFEFVYALGSVIALFHDILMTLGMVAIFNFLFPSLNLELSQGMVAAFLTLIGFSINDTVVVFDRIRENIKLYKNEDILKLMNRSVNATLSRTVITGGALFFAVLVLFLFGGEVNRSFAFTFLIGMITGTYSSIFVASAFVVDIKNIQHRRKEAAKHHTTRPAAVTKV